LSRYDSAAAKPATGPLPQMEAPGKPIVEGNPERKYEDNTLCKDDPAERTAFDAYLKAIGKPPASLESLRTWYRVAANGK
jgi:hypothetical protein